MTRIIPLQNVNEEIIQQCVRDLSNGAVVVVPTETVYGLICRADSVEAIERLYEMKGRPREKPFALFVSGIEDLAEWAFSTPQAEALAKRFWPGPLTMVLKAKPGCPAERDGGVGARSPAHDLVQALIRECGDALVNTSLNQSGQPPACSLEDAAEVVELADWAFDQGALPRRPPSSVVDLRDGEPKLLREGELSLNDIQAFLQSQQ